MTAAKPLRPATCRVQPVSVRLLAGGDDPADAAVYQGVSYCDAVRRAGEGEVLVVRPGSIQVCRWAPVVLGLKAAESRFERHLEPRLPFPTGGLLLASWDGSGGGREPDLVLLRARPERLARLVAAAGPDALWAGHGRRIDRSAAWLFDADRPVAPRPLVGLVNRLLARLAPLAAWQALTRWLFRSPAVTAGFDALIAPALADMSICRNSTVVPLSTGRANLSFFCTGGITWGRNDPANLTSGWPPALLRRALAREAGVAAAWFAGADHD